MYLFRSSTPRPLIYLAALCLAMTACGDDDDSREIDEPGLQQLKVGDGNFLWSESFGEDDGPTDFNIPEERLPDLEWDADDCLGSQGVQLFPGNAVRDEMDEFDAHFWTLERDHAHLDFSHSVSRNSNVMNVGWRSFSLGEATALLHIANDDSTIDLEIDWAIDGDTDEATGGNADSYANFEIQLYDPANDCAPLDDELGTISASFNADHDDGAIADSVSINTERDEVVVKLTVDASASVSQHQQGEGGQDDTVTSTAELDFHLDLDW